VKEFKEKPDEKTAEEYIQQGALWNGGVFAFKLGYMLRKAHELIEFADYEDLFRKYETLEKISFDYAVVEHEPWIQVMRFGGQWKDASYSVICAPDVLTNAESIEKLSAADCVVLVEKQEESTLADISKEIEALRAWNKTVLGAVVVNADAVM